MPDSHLVQIVHAEVLDDVSVDVEVTRNVVEALDVAVETIYDRKTGQRSQ